MMMSGPWKELIEPEQIEIVARDGTVRSSVIGYYSGTQFVIDDMTVDVREGDEIRRMLPNGKEEAFVVKNPKCYKSGDFGPHYQVEVGRKGVYDKHTGGNYHINVNGTNARVNLGSTDQSVNVAIGGDTFNELRKVLAGISDANEREKLKNLLGQIEAARDQKTFGSAYQAFIASAADHMTIIAPFLPALAQMLTQLRP